MEAVAIADPDPNAARQMNELEWAAQRLLREAFGRIQKAVRIDERTTPQLWADRRFVSHMTIAAACRWPITTEDMVRMFRLVKRYRRWIVEKMLEDREGPRARLRRLRKDPTIRSMDKWR